jgi:molecular chaperone HtpG
MSASVTEHQFQAEVQQLLDIVINSLYSNKDIFLRELISNASDAIDKRQFESLTDESLSGEGDPSIRLERDPELRTLFLIDDGIGMTEEELVTNLGTIARSGTAEFLKNAGNKADAPDLIGQFGVGFYSSFMVADRVEVLTRKAGEEKATKWESAGQGSYHIEEAERAGAGTTIILHLKNVDGDNGIKDYTDEWVLKEIVRRYSDFVSYPIVMKTTTPGTDDEPAETKDETLNSQEAIWTRDSSEVTDEEYQEFYKHITHDWTAPLTRVASKLEGAVDARTLIFVPSKAPMDLYHREMSYRGLQLYVKRVFIMDECRDLMPTHLRFIKGVVDAENLSLNVSRELLQQDRQISAIRKFLVRKVMDELKKLKNQKPEKYQEFWTQFGAVLKEGLLSFEEKKEAILDLTLVNSSADESITSLSEYVARMRPNQEHIFYLTAPTLDAARHSPHAEVFLERGLEVVYFTDPVDEVWLQQPPEFEGKQWKSVDKGEVDLGDEEEDKGAVEKLKEQTKSHTELVAALQEHLSDQIKEIRLTNRLTTSAACLVGDANEMSPQILEMLRQAGQEVPESKRTLELNPDHAIVTALKARHAGKPDDPALKSYAQLLFGQAVLAEGGQLEDPVAFGDLVASLMSESLTD